MIRFGQILVAAFVLGVPAVVPAAAGDTASGPPRKAALVTGKAVKGRRVLVLASRVVGEPVIDAGHGRMGVVKDLILDASQGRVTHVIVVRERTGRMLAVPIDDTKIEPLAAADLGTRVRVRNSKSALSSSFPAREWRDRSARPRLDHLLLASLSEGRAEPEHRLVRFGELLRYVVENARRDDVGDVDDLVMDASTGRIRDVIVSSGEFRGKGKAIHAIPWKFTTVDAENAVLMALPKGGRRAVVSFCRTGDDGGARDRWYLHQVLLRAKAKAPAGPKAVVLSVRPGRTYRYRVVVKGGAGTVAGWESIAPREKTSGGQPETKSWMRKLVIRVLDVRQGGGFSLEVWVELGTEGERAAKPIHYRVRMNAGGQVGGLRAVVPEGGQGPGAGEEALVRDTLVLIFGGDLPGRELVAGRKIPAPACLERFAAVSGTGQGGGLPVVHYVLSSATARKDAVVVGVVSKGRDVGRSVYRGSDGMLEELAIRPGGAESIATLLVSSLREAAKKHASGH